MVAMHYVIKLHMRTKKKYGFQGNGAADVGLGKLRLRLRLSVLCDASS